MWLVIELGKLLVVLLLVPAVAIGLVWVAWRAHRRLTDHALERSARSIVEDDAC